MFKTDKKSLERLSFDLNERDIANLRSTLAYFQANDLLTLPVDEVQTMLFALDAAGQLRMEGKVYAFHVYDTYAEEQSGRGSGIEMYRRHGDLLRGVFMPMSRQFVYDFDEAVAFLDAKKAGTIYTGHFPPSGSFLNIAKRCDDDDPIFLSALEDDEVERFGCLGIEVVRLDYLI